MEKTQIVILNWNGKEHLAHYLPRVMATTPTEVEIVVADNGSTDGSVEMLEERFPQVTLLRLDDNYGFTGGYNRALAALSADYFVLMNSDIEPTEGWFEPLLEQMKRDERLVAVSPKILSDVERGRFEYAGAAGGFIDMFGYPFCRGRILAEVEKDCGQYDDACDVFWVSGACMMVKADKFAEIGGFDEKFFAHMEEIDFCWRAQLYGYRVAVEPRSKVYHLGGGTLPNNSPRKLYLNFRNNLAMLHKNLSDRALRIVMPLRMFLDSCSMLVYRVMGKRDFVLSVKEAHRDYRQWREELDRQRKEIKERRVVDRIGTVYRGSILLRYFLGFRRFGNIM